MMVACVQALIGVAGEAITDKHVMHGRYSTMTLRSTPAVQRQTI
jgi:hypothetical protein